MQGVIRMTYGVVLCHPDEITNLMSMSSGWLSHSHYLFRMTYDQCRMSSGWLTMLAYVIRMRYIIRSLSRPDDLATLRVSSGWLMANVLSHPDDLWPMQDVIRMTYDAVLCHPDEITNLMAESSRWLSWRRYLIRTTYGKSIMSSGWHTLPSYVTRMT